jgi:hypothetical protein
MPFRLETESYSEQAFEFIEQTWETSGGGDQLVHKSDGEFDVFAHVSLVEGTWDRLEITGEDFESLESADGSSRMFNYNADYGREVATLTLTARVWTKVKVIFAKIRRNVVGNVSCKGCKYAVKTVVSAILSNAGVPLPALGDDLSHAQGALQGALEAFRDGRLGSALENLRDMLPELPGALHAINWIWDAYDTFLQRVCREIQLCP